MSTPVAEVPTNTVPDLNSLLLAQLAPIATQAAEAATAAVRAELASLQADVAKNQHAVETALAGAGTTLLAKAEADPWTPRFVIAGVVAACLVVLVAAMLGNSEAQRYIGGVPAAAGVLVALMARLEGIPWPAQKG